MSLLRSSCVLALVLCGNAVVAQAQRLHANSRAAENKSVEFDVYLPLQHTDELSQLLVEQQTVGSPNYHKWLTPKEFGRRFGPSSQDIATVTGTLAYYGLSVVQVHSHGVRVQGTVRAAERALGLSLWNATTPNGKTRLIAGEAPTLPEALQKLGAQVVHFAPLAGIRPRVVVKSAGITADNRNSSHGSYWFDDLKQAYDFPSYQQLTGRGTTIAVMSVSDYLDSDINAYFSHESTSTAPINSPTIIRAPLYGGTPFNPNSSNSIECELDLQQAGGMAPGATLLLVNLPSASDGAFLDGYLNIVESDAADIVSTSFGSLERLYTAEYNSGTDYTGILKIFDEVFEQGNAQGITFVVSSGDYGAVPLPPLAYFTTPPQNPPAIVGQFLASVDSFAASPHVTAVGGTNLITTYSSGSLDSSYVGENAYPDPLIPYDPYGTGNLVSGGVWGSGGGKSVVFPKPAYQFLVNTTADTRTVPDIAMQMGGCPGGIAQSCNPTDSSAIEVFNGSLLGVVGTSVAAPEFAGVLAVFEEYLGSRLGNVNYVIYAEAAAQPNGSGTSLDFFHQDQRGSNGRYKTGGNGYNLVLGVGTPSVRNFILAPKLRTAGTPQTPDNP